MKLYPKGRTMLLMERSVGGGGEEEKGTRAEVSEAVTSCEQILKFYMVCEVGVVGKARR